jgi:anti-sigma factor RsiW
MNDEEFSSLIRQNAERHAASAQLRAAVQTQIALHVAGRKPPFVDRFKTFGPIKSWLGLADASMPGGAGFNAARQLSLGFAAGVVLTLALVWMMPRMPIRGDVPQAMLGDLLSLHVRAIGTGPLFQVASSDRHTVKPWFQGKLDYAPQVPDLHEAGFELLGGRVDHVQGHDTAVLSYQLRKHIISAYVMPGEQAASIERLQHRGFNIVHWSDGVMQIWAVTDADASELGRFVAAWQFRMAAAASPDVK